MEELKSTRIRSPPRTSHMSRNAADECDRHLQSRGQAKRCRFAPIGIRALGQTRKLLSAAAPARLLDERWRIRSIGALELARNFKEQKPEIGVVMVFFDGEDYGDFNLDEGVFLGSRHFARNVGEYKTDFGICWIWWARKS